MPPDYHFIYIDFTLGADWLFVAARTYWLRYRPIVATNLDVIALAPEGASVVITVLARRDFSQTLVEAVRTRFPKATLDPLVYDAPQELQMTLDGRAALDHRFGLPTPTATPGN
jgi:hypothetical protein